MFKNRLICVSIEDFFVLGGFSIMTNTSYEQHLLFFSIKAIESIHDDSRPALTSQTYDAMGNSVEIISLV